MPIGKDYRLTIGTGREELPPADDREGTTSRRPRAPSLLRSSRR